MVLHCNGRTYGNAYLITFKVGPLGTHTLAHSILPLLEAPVEKNRNHGGHQIECDGRTPVGSK